MQLDDVLFNIRQQGGRITKVRMSILEAFFQNKCLVSQEYIVSYLESKQLQPNPSTIFRELQFLLENKIINKSTIGKVHYYELNSAHQHYHFICSECQGITPLHLHNPLAKVMLEIEAKHSVQINQHSIDFSGLCRRCS